MILKIAYYYIKQRYSRGFLFIVVVAAVAPYLAAGPRVQASVALVNMSLVLSAMIAASALAGPALFRSEIDFAFSTPADPRSIFAGRLLAEGLVYLLLLALYTAPLQRPEPGLALYAASLVASAAAVGAFNLLLSFLRFGARAAAAAAAAVYLVGTAYLSPSLNAFYGLVRPSPLYAAALAALAAASAAAFPAGALRELYTNAYGLLERLQPRPRPAEAPAVVPGPMPRSLWQLAWRTTTRGAVFRMNTPSGSIYFGGRVNALAVAESISAAAAAAYLSIVFLLHVDSQGLAAATLVSALYLFLLLLASLSPGLSLERLWISFSADHYAYVRYRMAARSLASLLATSPWIIAYALASLRYPPAAYAAASLASASLTFPVLAWLIGAFWGQPQIREYGLAQRPARYTAKSLLSLLPVLSTVGLYLAPASLAAAAYSAPALSRLLEAAAVGLSAFIAASSAAFFYAALFTRLGRGLWDWLVDRLAAAGYV